MATASLSANSRQTAGKGAARSLRRAGKIPAVVYGRGRDPESIELDAVAVERMLTKVRSGTALLDVTVDGREPFKALIREIQRSPVRPVDILHMDLYEVHANEKISVQVPVKFVGTADGVRNGGGVFEVVAHDVTVRVLPANIPDHLDIDVTNLAVGHSLHVRDLTFANGEILTDGGVTLCTVVAPKVEEAAVPGAEGTPTAEPELIRKPKAADEEEGEAKE